MRKIVNYLKPYAVWVSNRKRLILSILLLMIIFVSFYLQQQGFINTEGSINFLRNQYTLGPLFIHQVLYINIHCINSSGFTT